MIRGKLVLLQKVVFKIFLVLTPTLFLAIIVFTFYFLGFMQGFSQGQSQSKPYIAPPLPENTLTPSPKPTTIIVKPTTAPTKSPQISSTGVGWGGPELWQAVNKRRQEFGINPLSSRSELCTIASIRLNELLSLGKLDNHEGFSNMAERRPDLKWIFDKYSIMAEFLAYGGKTAQETVSLWENTLGHRKLLDGGEYVWGCIYAQNTFAVAITAY